MIVKEPLPKQIQHGQNIKRVAATNDQDAKMEKIVRSELQAHFEEPRDFSQHLKSTSVWSPLGPFHRRVVVVFGCDVLGIRVGFGGSMVLGWIKAHFSRGDIVLVY